MWFLGSASQVSTPGGSTRANDIVEGVGRRRRARVHRVGEVQAQGAELRLPGNPDEPYHYSTIEARVSSASDGLLPTLAVAFTFN